MDLENIKQQTTWNDAAEGINSNFAKVDIEIEKLKNVTTRDKGYYQTVESLTAAHPTASVGSRAFVGYVAPYAVYVWDKATSKWVDTGETITDATLDLGDYYTKADVDNLVLAINRALGTKFGALYVDATTGLMSAFATEDDKQEWLETGNANLVLTQVNVGVGGGGGTSITIDTEMSDTSENAVQNKVIKAYVDAVKAELDAIVGGDATDAIDSINEILAFLSTMADSDTLAGIVANLKKMIQEGDDGNIRYTDDAIAALKLYLDDADNDLDEKIGNLAERVDDLESQDMVIDDAMSDTSVNPVQNKVIKKYVDDAVANVGAGAVIFDATSSTDPWSLNVLQTQTTYEEIAEAINAGRPIYMRFMSGLVAVVNAELYDSGDISLYAHLVDPESHVLRTIHTYGNSDSWSWEAFDESYASGSSSPSNVAIDFQGLYDLIPLSPGVADADMASVGLTTDVISGILEARYNKAIGAGDDREVWNYDGYDGGTAINIFFRQGDGFDIHNAYSLRRDVATGYWTIYYTEI